MGCLLINLPPREVSLFMFIRGVEFISVLPFRDSKLVSLSLGHALNSMSCQNVADSAVNGDIVSNE